MNERNCIVTINHFYKLTKCFVSYLQAHYWICHHIRKKKRNWKKLWPPFFRYYFSRKTYIVTLNFTIWQWLGDFSNKRLYLSSFLCNKFPRFRTYYYVFNFNDRCSVRSSYNNEYLNTFEDLTFSLPTVWIYLMNNLVLRM